MDVFNPILQDQSISLKTKGLYAFMVSLPDDWEYCISGLAVKAGVGKDAIRSGLKELEDHGYLVREQQCREQGKFSGGVVFILYDEPNEPPSSGYPTTGKPSSDNPSSENPIQQSKDQQSKNNKPPKAPRKGAAELKPRHIPEVFARFWAAYPRHTNKPAAIRAWDKLAPDMELCRRMSSGLAVQRHSDDWVRDNGRYIPLPATWLNGRRWEDEPPEVLEPAVPEKRYGWGCE